MKPCGRSLTTASAMTNTSGSASTGITTQGKPAAIAPTALAPSTGPSNVPTPPSITDRKACTRKRMPISAESDLDAGKDAIRSIVSINAKIVNATDEEAKAACVVIQTVLKHPIIRRAAGSAANGMLRRETQVIHKLADDTIVEGIVDLAFQEVGPGGALWTVVDFKTDREFSLSSERHVEQVRIYAGAIAAATGNKTRGVVMVI
jgi:ATP-dependent exoDNAse (exonuclease V) beta subunit